MNISFFDGVNDGKFYSINAGKYDEISEEDVDISTEVEEEEDEDDADTCINRFVALEKDTSKLHMDLNNLRNEFKGSCKDWNNLSDTVDHMLNSIAELKTIMNRADDRLNKRINVISEANVALTDKLNLVEKKLEVFKCIDILDRVTKLEERYETGIITFNELRDKLKKLDIDVTSNMKNNMDKANDRMGIIDMKLTMFYDILDRVMKLEEQIKPTVLEEAKELEVRPSVLDNILDRLGKLEEKVINTQLTLHSIDLKSNALEKKVNENLDWKDLNGTASFESNKNDIQDDPVNHPKHYTDGKYECIDFIEEYGTITHIGNAIKYISRNGKKDTSKYAEDLNKAFWYLHRYNNPNDEEHIDVIDYCHEKKLSMELTAVIGAISREEYSEAEKLLGDYITKITGKTPKALEDEQSK